MFPAAAIGTALLVFFVYSPALDGPFVFDDLNQPYHLERYPQLLIAYLWGVRPLLMVTYFLNRRISADPLGFHIANVIFHLINSFLVFFIVRKLLSRAEPRPANGDSLIAGFAAAVFLLHPIQTESVAYIAGRSESFSVLLFFAAFAVFLYRGRAAASWKVAIAVLLLFGGAVASKEHTIVLPGLLLLTDYFWNPGFSFSGIRRNWRVYAAMLVAGVAGLAFMIRVLAGATTIGFTIKEFTWYQYLFTECRAFFVYLRLFLFPAGQNLDRDFPVSRNLLDHGAILGAAAIVLLLAAAIYYRKRYPLACYGFLVFVLLLSPTSSFIPIKDPLAERRLYLPMIGLLLVVAEVVRRIPLDRRKTVAALGGIALLLAMLTFQRNRVWASDLALWEDTVAKSPGKARAHFQLAFVYYARGRCRDALAEYAAAARLEKPDHHLLVDWALAYDCAGQPDQAIAALQEAVALRPTAHNYAELGRMYARQAQWRPALEALELAEHADRYYPMTYYYRGGVLASTNNLTGAVEQYQHALALDSTNEPARRALAYVQQQMNRPH